MSFTAVANTIAILIIVALVVLYRYSKRHGPGD